MGKYTKINQSMFANCGYELPSRKRTVNAGAFKTRIKVNGQDKEVTIQ